MRILIVGAGATGGYFGARLAEAGRDVTFLVRPTRAEQLRRTGLVISSPHGDLTLAPQLLLSGAPTAPFDVAIVALKAYGLEPALDDIAATVGPDTVIVPFLNGMRHLDTLIARFGERPVLGGVCLVASTLRPDGSIAQLAPFQEIVYGERDGSRSDRIAALDAGMQGAGFKARASTEIMQEMWNKWMLLASGGALTCLLRGTVGDIEAVPGGVALALALVSEVMAVAAVSGYPPSEATDDRIRKTLTASGSPFATSMYRDLTGGLPVEAEQILGDMAARAKGFGLPSPLLEAATVQLRIYQSRLAAA
ncbi:MAG: ketopantoate reductase family protein [Acetobacteraceae bacterium]|nr:ketopantoate reductase family protein [Acetobacteraceae bacterium]